MVSRTWPTPKLPVWPSGRTHSCYVEERVAGVPKLEADGAWERRARRQKQQRAESREKRDRAVGDGVDVAAAAHRSEDDRVRPVCAEDVRAGHVEHRGGVTVHRALDKAGELVEGSMGDVRLGVQARHCRLLDQDLVAVGIQSRQEGNGDASGQFVEDERSRKWFSEVRREEGASAGSVGAG